MVMLSAPLTLVQRNVIVAAVSSGEPDSTS
jgi:hypothetical protein